MTSRAAWSHGLATITTSGTVLDTWFPEPHLGDMPEGAVAPEALTALVGSDDVRQVRRDVVLAQIDLDSPPTDAIDAYLRLHLLSHRLAEPNSINLDGLFGVLTNVVWTTQGPCAVEGFELTRAALRSRGPVQVLSVDKFPAWWITSCPPACGSPMPTGCAWGPPRVGDDGHARGLRELQRRDLGKLDGRGRISQGVVVGNGSDIGGGASTMGTLPGWQRAGAHRRTLPARAESGLGIALGDDCVVEAGLYVTAGTKGDAAGRDGGQGTRPLGAVQPALPPGLGDWGRPGPAARRPRDRAQLRPAQQRLTSRR